MDHLANVSTLANAKPSGGNVDLQETEYRDRVSKVWTKVAWFSRKARNSDLIMKGNNFDDHKNSVESMEQFIGVHSNWSSDDSLDSLDDHWLMESDNTTTLQAKSPLDVQLKGCVSRARAVFTGGQPPSNNASNRVHNGSPIGNRSTDIKYGDTDLQATIEDLSEACEALFKETSTNQSLETSTNQSLETSTNQSLENSVDGHILEDDALHINGLHSNGEPDDPSSTDNQYSVSVQFDSTVYESEHTACSDAEASSPVAEPQLTVNASPPLFSTTTVNPTKDVEYNKTPQKASTVFGEYSRSTLALRRIATPPYSAPLLRHHFPLLHSGSPSLSSLKNLSPCNSCSSIDAASLPGKLSEVGHSRLVQRAMSVPQGTCNNFSPILGIRNDMCHSCYNERSDCPFGHGQVHCNSPDVRQGNSYSNQDLVKRFCDMTREDNSNSPLCKQKRSYAGKTNDPLTQVPEMTVERMFMEERNAEGVLTRNEDHGSINSLQSVISGLQRSGGPVGQHSEYGSLWSLRSHCSSIRSRPGSHCCDRMHPSYSKGVAGNVFKERMEKILGWFNEFNDQQRNSMFTKLLGHCTCAQMHLLSVYMEPILHHSCPHNCEDFLSWLPPGLAFHILSYLDPVSLCRCSQVCYSWFNMANDPKLWMQLCRVDKWQLSPSSQLKQLKAHTLPDGRVQWKLIFAERYRLFSNWMKGRCTVRTFAGHTQGIMCIQFDDTRIVSGSSDKTIKVWNIRTNTPWAALTLAGHSGPVRCIHLYGNRLVSGSTDRTIKVWDLATDKVDWVGAACRATMVGHSHTVRCLQSDGEKVISGSYDHSLKVWDVKCGQCKVTLRGHSDAVLCLQFVGDTLVSGSSDQAIKVWSLPQGQCKMTLHGHQAAVTSVQFDQSRIISGSLDRFIKIWSINSGQCIRNLDWINAEGHTGVVRQLQVDRWKMVSAADDRTLKVWSLDSGNRLVTLQSHSDGVTCLQFSDTTIVSGSYDKTVKLWDFSAC